MTLDEILKEIEKAQSIVILTHESPDGDAIGSSLALKFMIEKLDKKIYHASSIKYSDEAKEKINNLKNSEYALYPICVAKTQYSFSDDQTMLGRPKDFVCHVQDIQIRSGAKFIVAIAGSIMLMPGLGKNPAACNMEIGENNVIKGLF